MVMADSRLGGEGEVWVRKAWYRDFLETFRTAFLRMAMLRSNGEW